MKKVFIFLSGILIFSFLLGLYLVSNDYSLIKRNDIKSEIEEGNSVSIASPSPTVEVPPISSPIPSPQVISKDDDTDVNDYGNTIGNIANFGIAAKSNGWVYYCKASGNSGLYKQRIDGKENTKLCDDVAYYINLYHDWIYFRNVSDGGKLYKIKLDGTGKQKINA